MGDDQRRGLTIGDALAIGFLLVFVLVWIGGLVALALTSGEERSGSTDAGLVVIVLGVVLAPVVGPLLLVWRIVQRANSGR